MVDAFGEFVGGVVVVWIGHVELVAVERHARSRTGWRGVRGRILIGMATCGVHWIGARGVYFRAICRGNVKAICVAEFARRRWIHGQQRVGDARNRGWNCFSCISAADRDRMDGAGYRRIPSCSGRGNFLELDFEFVSTATGQ